MGRVTVVVDNRVRLETKDVPPKVLQELKTEFTFDNPTLGFKRAMGLPTWGEPRKFHTFYIEGSEISFPRGGLKDIRVLLDAHDIKIKVLDRRTEGSPCNNFPNYIGYPLRYYQEDAIQAAIKRENCVIRAPTGSGKSLLGIALASRIKLNTLIILPTVGLFKQWCDDAKSSLDIKPDDLGVIHGKKRKLRPITATVQATLASQGVDEEINDYFGVIIYDEVQKAASRTCMQVVDSFSSRYRIGVSADERRKDKKEFITEGLFGSVGFQIDRKTLEEEGFILDVEIRVVPTKFRADWYGVAQNEEDEKQVDFNRLLQEMTTNDVRNQLIEKFALDETSKGNQLLLLTHRREHCQVLDQTFVKNQVKTGFFIGGADYAVEFEKTRAGIKDQSIQVGVGTYTALGVGVNLPAVGVGIATTPISGNKYFVNQVRGRLCRPSGKDKKARLYIIWDEYVYPSHLRNLTSTNPSVVVYDKGKWIPAKTYLAGQKKRVI